MKDDGMFLFLGAGASAPFDYPVTRTFLEILSKSENLDELENSCLNTLLMSFLEPDAEDIIVIIRRFNSLVSETGRMLPPPDPMFSFLWKNLVDNQNIFSLSSLRPPGTTHIVGKTRLHQLLNSILSKIYKEVYVQYRFKPDSIPKEKELLKPLFQYVADFNDSQIIDIFTTNYDTAIENFCGVEPDLGYIDGFAPTPGKVNWIWSPNNFEIATIPKGKTVIKLRKLHGSLNWHRRKVEEVIEKSDLEYEIDPNDPNFSENVLIRLADPSIPKKEPFTYLYKDFRDSTTKMDYALVIGFSFRDPEINNTFIKMLDENPDSKIIVVGRHASVNIKENLCKDVDKANELIKQKRLVPIEILFDEPKKVDMVKEEIEKIFLPLPKWRQRI